MTAYVIAEAGTGHACEYEKARKELAFQHVDAAKEAGASAIKFQMFVPDQILFCPLDGDEDRKARWNQSSMSKAEWAEVKKHAEKSGLDFLCSVFQLRALDLYKSLNPKAYKVASRAAWTFPYDQAPGPYYVSLGNGRPTLQRNDVTFLQCVMKYPAPPDEAKWLGDGGLSDHSGTTEIPIDAISRGCELIEVHFTIGNAGPDEKVALSVPQLKAICESRDAVAQMRQG